MPKHNGNPIFRGASGSGAGRGDNAHAQKQYSEVRNMSKETLGNYQDNWNYSHESGPTTMVSSSDMGNVRSDYRDQRKSGVSAQDARTNALRNTLSRGTSYPGASGFEGQR